MTRRRRVLAAGALALASFIALTGCTGHVGATRRAMVGPHYPTLDDALPKRVQLPGLVDGTDGQSNVLVRLNSPAGQAKPQLHTSGYGFDYGIFDTTGKRLEWATPSPVADAYDAYLTTAGLYVQREGEHWDLSRVDPRTGSVLWTFNQAARGPANDLYSYDTFWNDSGSGGDIVVLSHYFDDAARTQHHELTVLDARTGQPRFAVPSEKPNLTPGSRETTHNVKVLSFAPLITATTGGSSYSAVESRDPVTGKVIAALDPSWFPSTPLETTGNAFVTAVANNETTTMVIARDAQGKEIWTRVVDEAKAAVVAADADHVLVQAPGFEATIFALDAATGELEGAYTTSLHSTVSAFLTRLVAPDLMTVTWTGPRDVYLVPVPGAKK